MLNTSILQLQAQKLEQHCSSDMRAYWKGFSFRYHSTVAFCIVATGQPALRVATFAKKALKYNMSSGVPTGNGELAKSEFLCQ